jgi:carbonic anhydrase
MRAFGAAPRLRYAAPPAPPPGVFSLHNPAAFLHASQGLADETRQRFGACAGIPDRRYAIDMKPMGSTTKNAWKVGAWKVAALVFAAAALAQAADNPAHAVHWGYAGNHSPDHWGSLSHEFALCGSGKSQSPVDLSATLRISPTAISTHYRPTPLRIVNNGHTIQVNYAPGSYAELGGKRHELLQFHFHSPSEHTVDGKHAAMEAHLVHRDVEGNLAVVGVLLKQGHELDDLQAVWMNLPQHEGEKSVAGVEVDATKLLPRQAEVYSYSGSLTTPPCSEGVSWFVMREPMEVSADQIKAFRSIIPPNARPVQPLNGRGALTAHR